MPDTSYGYTRIRQLPEAGQLQSTDFMVIENDLDTWKVSVAQFNQYIDEYIDSFKSDINGDVDDKFNEIQLIVNQINEIIVNAEQKMDDFAAAEAIRQAQEAARQNAESIRNETFEDIETRFNDMRDIFAEIEAAEEQRKKNETGRQTAESERENAESDRQSAEATREAAETNRATAESLRQSAEASREAAEDIRKSNETARINTFDGWTQYIEALKESVNNYKKFGKSIEVTTATPVVTLLNVSVPTSTQIEYQALLYLRASGSEYGWLALTLDISNPDDYNITMHMSDNTKSKFPISNFKAYYTPSADTILITLEYKATKAGYIDIGIMWDNISGYKDDVSPIYSEAVSDDAPRAAFTAATNYQVRLLQESVGDHSLPETFIDMLNNIDIAYQESQKPEVEVYPIGSIYQSTSSENPATILGGGTWKLLYGDSISEGVEIEGEAEYSPQIYTWERIG